MDGGIAAVVAGLLALGLGAPEPAAAEASWDIHLLCLAQASHGELAMLDAIKARNAKEKQPEDHLTGLDQLILAVSRKQVAKHLADARAAMERDFEAWAAAERRAGRSPGSMEDTAVAAAEAAGRRAVELSHDWKAYHELGRRCEDLAGGPG